VGGGEEGREGGGLFIERVQDLVGLVHESIDIAWSIREDHRVALRSDFSIHCNVFTSEIQLCRLLTCSIFRNSCGDLLNRFPLSFSSLNNRLSLIREMKEGSKQKERQTETERDSERETETVRDEVRGGGR
jgi:hypothetical protein